jgi:GR25 family glycosyltransferase involved in LPS biosynthesis
VDRRREAARQFACVGLQDRVEFHIVAKHPTNCEQGIYTSHLDCLARGLKGGAQHILIFEDDVVFANYSPQILARGLAGLELLNEWQVCFFGCMVSWVERTSTPALVRIGYRSLAHAYGVNRSFAEFLVQHHPWRGTAYDDLLRDFKSSRMYALYPACAFQSNASSDNDVYLPLDRFRRCCGGLKNLQRLNEFYHRFCWWIVGGHVLVLFGLGYWLW